MATKSKTPKKTSATEAPKRKADNPEQYKRFREFAREVEADQDQEAFDRTFRKIVTPSSRS